MQKKSAQQSINLYLATLIVLGVAILLIVTVVALWQVRMVKDLRTSLIEMEAMNGEMMEELDSIMKKEISDVSKESSMNIHDDSFDSFNIQILKGEGLFVSVSDVFAFYTDGVRIKSFSLNIPWLDSIQFRDLTATDASGHVELPHRIAYELKFSGVFLEILVSNPNLVDKESEDIETYTYLGKNDRNIYSYRIQGVNYEWSCKSIENCEDLNDGVKNQLKNILDSFIIIN